MCIFIETTGLLHCTLPPGSRINNHYQLLPLTGGGLIWSGDRTRTHCTLLEGLQSEIRYRLHVVLVIIRSMDGIQRADRSVGNDATP